MKFRRQVSQKGWDSVCVRGRLRRVVEYEYRGLMAEAWDLLRGDTSTWTDRAYYLEVIRNHGQPVLDVGCGTGRLLLDFLGLGIDIDGIDNSPEMLALCHAKAAAAGLEAAIFQQEMQAVSLPRKYKTILIPSSSLQLVIAAAARDEALRRLRSYLLPGGAVVASFMTVWREGTPLESERARSVVRPRDGATIRRIQRSRFNPETECEDTEDIYQVIRDAKVVEEEVHRRAPATREYSQEQARAAFASAGFGDVVLTSEFTQGPATPADFVFVVTASR